jgi:hypothetical protein
MLVKASLDITNIGKIFGFEINYKLLMMALADRSACYLFYERNDPKLYIFNYCFSQRPNPQKNVEYETLCRS